MKVKLDATEVSARYSQAFRQLRRLTGFDHRTVLRAEAGVILKTWAGRTEVATDKQATIRARLRAARTIGVTTVGAYEITINVGVRAGAIVGIVWYRSSRGGTRGTRWQVAGYVSDDGVFKPSWIHFKAAAWADIKMGAEKYAALIAKMIPMGKRSTTLARQSVIQIADDLGINLSDVKGGGNISSAAIAKARAAIASTGTAYKNGIGTQGGDETKAFIDLSNRYPKNTKIGMDRTLAGILIGRAKAIEMAYEKGAFDSMKNTARAFPNLIRVFQTGGTS